MTLNCFRNLEFLGWTRFENNAELKETVTDLDGPVTEDCDATFQKLVKRYDKCLNLYGNYVEK